jgi:hypothetical protein
MYWEKFGIMTGRVATPDPGHYDRKLHNYQLIAQPALVMSVVYAK